MPVNVGVLSFVSLSLLDLPLSVPAVRSGVDGAFTDVSMVMFNPDDALLTLPATSVAFAVIA